MGETPGDLKVARSVGHGIILVLFCYLIINLSQFFAWFGWPSSAEVTSTNESCPVNLSSYLLYESISSAFYFILSTGIIAGAMAVSSGLNSRVATFFMVVAIISGVMRMLLNSIACYWIDTYPRACRNSPIYKMALASVILFFILNVPVVLFHGRLISEKFIVWLNTKLQVSASNIKPGINLAHLVNSPKYSDVTLEVDSVVFYAHKVILSSRCEYFAKLLYGGMKESTQIGPISIKEVSTKAFLQILEFAYTNNINNLDVHNLEELIELMRCVDLLSFNLLKDYIEKSLESKLNSYNLVPILLASRKYNFATETLAIEKLLKMKHRLKESEAAILKDEPDLFMKLVSVSIA